MLGLSVLASSLKSFRTFLNRLYHTRTCVMLTQDSWNVHTLHRVSPCAQLADALIKCKTNITAIQEMRWIGQACKRLASCDMYYSCHVNKHEFGRCFVLSKRLRHLVPGFTSVNERIATIIIYNISLICVHAPTEEKDDVVKNAFYTKLEDVYDKCSAHGAKTVLRDFNAKIGRRYLWPDGRTVQPPGEHYL